MLRLKPYFPALILVMLLGSTLLFTACGQTGDLYLPEDEAEKTSKEKSKN